MFAWIVRSKELLLALACLRVLCSLAPVHLLELALALLLEARPRPWVLMDVCQARLLQAASIPRVVGRGPPLVILRARPERLIPAVQCHPQLLSLLCLAPCPPVLAPCLLVLAPCPQALAPCRLAPAPCLPAPVFGQALAHGQ